MHQTALAPSSLPRDTTSIAAECERRQCRFGLRGLRAVHQPTGTRFFIRSSRWDRGHALTLFSDFGESAPAHECKLVDRWPVRCCRPMPKHKWAEWCRRHGDHGEPK
jgi:hypothetical protein